ncbi:hypothetical protein [Actinomadura nitritigenes]|uniref:hypothetical protein n=1 Tax=Actinomadura nitritigenes TaxID=134602 RepID=UPI003D91645E
MTHALYERNQCRPLTRPADFSGSEAGIGVGSNRAGLLRLAQAVAHHPTDGLQACLEVRVTVRALGVSPGALPGQGAGLQR